MRECFLSRLEKPSATIHSTTVTVETFALYRVDRVIVVPAELGAGFDRLGGEECHPRELEIIAVDEHVLHKYIGSARVIEITTYVAAQLGINHVHVLIL